MKIAFATQDLQRVDAHFGWARNLAVYEISPDGFSLLEAIQFSGDLQEDGNEDKLAPKIEAIKDCAILYVAAIGLVLGRVTRFRRVDGGLQYRLSRTGLAWWAVFLGVRVGSFLLATTPGARLAESSGFLLLSFGVPRPSSPPGVRLRQASGCDDPALADQAGEGAGREGAAREAEDEDLVPGTVVEDEKAVGLGDVVDDRESSLDHLRSELQV